MLFATSLLQIVPVLQVAIGPVILISGIGLLLLTMTNRLGRAIDRARQLCHLAATAEGRKRDEAWLQLTILYRRARIIRLSIAFAGWSVLLAAALIIVLFMGALFNWQNAIAVGLVFIASMLCLFVSLVAFLYDINLTLHALRLEVKAVRPGLD